MLTYISKISDKFEVLNQIGEGGYARVFKAKDKITQMLYALKIYDKYYLEEGNKSDYLKNNIKREIEIMKICNSKNIIKLYDSFETNDSYILVLELCDIDLISYVIKNEEKRNLFFIQSIFLELNNAFKLLTQNYIIHRDIKPANIFLKFEGDKIVPKLSDFGISRFSKNLDYKEDYNGVYYNVSFKTSTVGTFHYMAPEILKGEKYDNKCDLYSLGVTLYVLFFSKFPFNGLNEIALINQIKNIKLSILKSGLKSFDDLIEKLLAIEPENRLSWKEYFNHKFFKEDLKDYKTKINKIDIEDNKKNNEIEKICDIAKKMYDIMKIPNVFTKNEKYKNLKISNILYYDENINKHLEEIHHDSDFFERKTPGAFILSSNILSLNLVMDEIKKYNQKYDKRVVFNLIVTGSKCQTVMDNLIKYKYIEFIQNICIYCMRIEKYDYLKKKYSKIIGVYDDPSQVESFIEKVSMENTKEFPMLRTINYYDYIDEYYDRHEKISQFYGDLTKETYEKSIKNLEKFVGAKKEEEIKIKKNELIESFKTFDISKDLEILDKLIIREYTKNTFYGDLNNWLKTLDKNTYDVIAYYTARLMFSLNSYAKKTNNFYNEKKILFRGAKTNYINLLPFERLKGKIILLTSFTSTSEDESIAIEFSGREKSKEIFEENRKFSVIYKITNIVKSNCIPCGINIQEVSEYEEKEILFLPFTFYFVKNVVFDFKKYTVDIDLETISKKEILEEKIKEGKKVIYNKQLNMVIIDD